MLVIVVVFTGADCWEFCSVRVRAARAHGNHR